MPLKSVHAGEAKTKCQQGENQMLAGSEPQDAAAASSNFDMNRGVGLELKGH